jgi:hypothetical protein
MHTQIACRSASAPGVRRLFGIRYRPSRLRARSARWRQRPPRRQRRSVQRLRSGQAIRSSISAARKRSSSSTSGVGSPPPSPGAGRGRVPSSALSISWNSATASSTVSFVKGDRPFSLPSSFANICVRIRARADPLAGPDPEMRRERGRLLGNPKRVLAHPGRVAFRRPRSAISHPGHTLACRSALSSRTSRWALSHQRRPAAPRHC